MQNKKKWIELKNHTRIQLLSLKSLKDTKLKNLENLFTDCHKIDILT